MAPPTPAPSSLAIESALEPFDVSVISSGRALVAVQPATVPSVIEGSALPPTIADDAPFRDLDVDANVRKMSPRTMANLSMELYAAGAVNWEEYDMLAFQPELNPNYDNTVGALTGEKAEPNRPRDFITHWEKRLRFEQRHNRDRAYVIERTRHILNILYMLDVRARLLNLD